MLLRGDFFLILTIILSFKTNLLLCKSKIQFITNYTLPKCAKHGDTIGEWKSMNLIYSNETERNRFMQHFYGGFTFII